VGNAVGTGIDPDTDGVIERVVVKAGKRIGRILHLRISGLLPQGSRMILPAL
jgi:hypothetical protein